MERATVILYGMTESERKKVKGVCRKLDVRLRNVLPEEAGQPVGAFAGAAAFAEQAEPWEPEGPMLVFAGITDRQLERFLSDLRTARVGYTALKAVLTPTNAQWTGRQLYEELTKERESLGDHPRIPGMNEEET